MTQPQSQLRSSRRIPSWRFWTPLALQLALLVSVPAQSAYTYFTGTTVTLATAPVDPYDFLRGYYQTLSYQISDASRLQQLPGGELLAADASNSLSFYLVLAAPAAAAEPPPAPWQPVRISAVRPADLAPNQVAIQGVKAPWGAIRYGLEAYYLPESQRQQINRHIADVQRQDAAAFVVDVRVDRRGNAVPVRLWVDESPYRF